MGPTSPVMSKLRLSPRKESHDEFSNISSIQPDEKFMSHKKMNSPTDTDEDQVLNTTF